MFLKHHNCDAMSREFGFCEQDLEAILFACISVVCELFAPLQKAIAIALAPLVEVARDERDVGLLSNAGEVDGAHHDVKHGGVLRLVLSASTLVKRENLIGAAVCPRLFGTAECRGVGAARVSSKSCVESRSAKSARHTANPWPPRGFQRWAGGASVIARAGAILAVARGPP